MARPTTRSTRAAEPAVDDDLSLSLAEALPSYRRHLAAENKAPSTIAIYGPAVERLERYLRDQGMPTRLAAIRREHVALNDSNVGLVAINRPARVFIW